MKAPVQVLYNTSWKICGEELYTESGRHKVQACTYIALREQIRNGHSGTAAQRAISPAHSPEKVRFQCSRIARRHRSQSKSAKALARFRLRTAPRRESQRQPKGRTRCADTRYKIAKRSDTARAIEQPKFKLCTAQREHSDQPRKAANMHRSTRFRVGAAVTSHT